MKLETKFNLGQYVYGIACCSEEVHDECPVCKGKGTISLNGQEYECPECWGNGYKTHLTSKNWHITKHSHIGKVSVELIDGHYLEYYMLKSTGVISGSLWHKDLLFASKKEAEEACAYRNTNNIQYNYSCSVSDESNRVND